MPWRWCAVPAAQDEEERQLAVALLASAGDKKTRSDRRKERKERKEAARLSALVRAGGWVGGEEGRKEHEEAAPRCIRVPVRDLDLCVEHLAEPSLASR